MIVIDPVITDTRRWPISISVRPKPVWCLAALSAVLVQEALCDEAFAEHVTGVEQPREALRDVPVGGFHNDAESTRN